MSYSRRLAAGFAASLFALLVWSGSWALSQDALLVTVQNNTGQTVSDLHVTFAGSGGVLRVDPLTVVTNNCPVPRVPSNPPAVSNRVDIDWGVACVQNTETVAFLVTTPNGPLRYISGYWTLNGARVGDIRDSDITFSKVKTTFGIPGSGGSSAPFGAFKIQARYTPCGLVIYTPWYFQFPRCWFRICCFPFGLTCEYRVVYCPFTLPWFRFWEFAPWYPLTPWIKGGKTGPLYIRVRVTYEPKEVHAKPPKMEGPPADKPEDTVFDDLHVLSYGQTVRYSDDNGYSFREGADFTSSFLELANALALTSETPDEVMGFEENLLDMAPRYEVGATALDPLIQEAQITMDMVEDPNQAAVMQKTIGNLGSIRDSLCKISDQFYNLAVDDPSPYRDIEQALLSIADTLEDLDAKPRFQNAAATMREMSVGLKVAADMVEKGMPDLESKDFFLWGLMNRFQPSLRQFALAMNPHTRINVDFKDYEWCRSTGYGVHYKVQDQKTAKVIDEGTVNFEDTNSFDIPIFSEGDQLAVYIKPPTHLSRVLSFTTEDGLYLNGGTLIAGDANGDNCVDEADLEMVSADLGSGGLEAEAVNPTDVNFDGLVNDVDLAIVEANLGKCGEELPRRPEHMLISPAARQGQNP